jgi:hypothetical protein
MCANRAEAEFVGKDFEQCWAPAAERESTGMVVEGPEAGAPASAPDLVPMLKDVRLRAGDPAVGVAYMRYEVAQVEVTNPIVHIGPNLNSVEGIDVPVVPTGWPYVKEALF